MADDRSHEIRFQKAMEGIATLAAERDRYREALERVREVAGKVCGTYEVCEHRSCMSAYNAWAVADAYLNDNEQALNPTPEEE